jgi:hypothetical protein
VSHKPTRRVVAPIPDGRIAGWLLLAVAALVLAAGLRAVAPTPADARARLTQCGNNVDDDHDGKTDFPAEPGCTSAADNNEADPANARACSDGMDNDGDGKTDYPAEPGCASAADNNEADPTNRPACSDGSDNDVDGATDYPSDRGCTSASDTSEADKACSDGQDDDGDGLIDFPSDLGCSSPTDTDETDPPQCDDGRDNDGDGTLDFDTSIPGQTADSDCASALDTLEAPGPVARCADGKDNDGDGKIDYPADPGCTSPTDNEEADAPPLLVFQLPASCNDGRDNDSDGKTDFPADPGCSSSDDDDETDVAVRASSDQQQMLTPFPVVRLRGRVDRSSTRITLFTVRAPSASRVSTYCSGPSCPRRRLSVVAGRRTVRVRRFERRLRAGTVLRIYVTKPGFVGKYTRFRIINGRAPLRVDRCVRQPGSRPHTCTGS